MNDKKKLKDILFKIHEIDNDNLLLSIECTNKVLSLFEDIITNLIQTNIKEEHFSIIFLLENQYLGLKSLLILMENGIRKYYEIMRSFFESYIYLIFILEDKNKIDLKCQAFIYFAMKELTEWNEKYIEIYSRRGHNINPKKKLNTYDKMKDYRYQKIEELSKSEKKWDNWFKLFKDKKGNKINSFKDLVDHCIGNDNFIYNLIHKRLSSSIHSTDFNNYFCMITSENNIFEPHQMYSDKEFQKILSSDLNMILVTSLFTMTKLINNYLPNSYRKVFIKELKILVNQYENKINGFDEILIGK